MNKQQMIREIGAISSGTLSRTFGTNYEDIDAGTARWVHWVEGKDESASWDSWQDCLHDYEIHTMHNSAQEKNHKVEVVFCFGELSVTLPSTEETQMLWEMLSARKKCDGVLVRNNNTESVRRIMTQR